MATKLTRCDHLEKLFRCYADLPRESVFKEDLLNEGMAIVPRPVTTGLKDIAVEGGPYDLRRTIVRVRVRPDSPYLLTSKEAGWAVTDRDTGSALASARKFPEDSGYSRRVCAGNLAFGNVLDPDGEAVVFRDCQFSVEDRCRQCNLRPGIGAPNLAPIDRGVTDPAHLVQAVGELFAATEWQPRERPNSITITGGSIQRKLLGKAEEDFYLQYVVASKPVIRNRYPLLLEMSPKPRNVEARLRQEGVNGRLSNLVTWDPKLFAALCPGKERSIGWEEWVHRLVDLVDVYGQGHVLPGIMIGLDMLEPWGRRTLGEAVKASSRGFEFLMQHGAIPRPLHVWPELLTDWQGERPPVELFLETDRAWYETWQKHSLSEPAGHRMGPGRTRFAESATFDVGRGTPLYAGNAKNKQGG